ncbi:MAG: hydantoinase/oxoprolinase family protein [Chloroflexota bacterium]
MSNYRVSADIGGTFTDIVVSEVENNTTRTGKVLTTPTNPAEGVMQGVTEMIGDAAAMDFFVHGTTVGLNAFLERKGKRVLLIMNEGLRDAYTIARGDRKTLYELQYSKPELLVPRRDVHEVRGRLRWDGSEMVPLNESDFDSIIEKVRAEGIESIAVCFVHAFTNPAHELQAKEILTKALPDVSVSVSHELAREWREYERASTAVMNSYIAPIVQRYLKSLEENLSDSGLSIPVHIMQSNGGVTRAETAREQPIHTLLSGPVGGTIGGAALAEQIGRPNLLCVDMGGTSFDMSLIVDGKPSISNEAELEGLPLLLSLVEIHTIGAGGGSVAWLEAGALRVGPHSAGADPGPACYGKGGTQPTVTDANLFLGRIGRNAKLGGWMELDFGATESAIHGIAEQLGLGDVELAEGILAIINAKMADAIRTITIQQGIDPRDFAIVAFGGAGSMHAVWLARELDIPEVIVPWSPGTFSAWGMLQTDIRRDLTANFFKQVATITNEDVAEVLDQLSGEGRELLFAEKVSEEDIAFEFSADMRYIGQEYFVNVPIMQPIDLAAIEESFHNAHATRYGHSTPGAPVEFVNLRVGAIGKLDTKAGAFTPNEQAGDPVIETRAIIFDGESIDTQVLDRDAIPVGSVYKGPLVIDENSATTVIPPGYDLHIDDFGNLIIRKEG